MKISASILLLFLSLPAVSAERKAPQLELEMTGPEYRAIENRLHVSFSDALQDVLTLGKRNLDWLEKINATRPGNKLELSTPATQVGIPIDHPSESNREIVLSQLGDLKREMPRPMAQVLFATSELPTTAPVDDDTYLKFARLTDKIYQRASRWLQQEPYLGQYAMRSVMDIRGYYYLQKEEGLEAKLAGFASLDDETRTRLSGWLVGQCLNASVSAKSCKSELAREVRKGSATAYYEKYLPSAKRMYQGFFDIQNARSDVKWTSADPDVLKVAFKDPEIAPVKEWLVDNIEDEWRIGSWNLRLDFSAGGWGTPHLEFEEGATPHVNAIGGDTITMDANRSIQEYTTRWTIRHEFGHVLGFPDCYIEYYDTDRKVMINYQIDTSNLMCSRTGKFQQLHQDELRKAYFRG